MEELHIKNMLMNEYEKIAWSNSEIVMGIDEAGRGPLCGPLVVGACVFPCNYENDEINDSKKLSEKKREKLFDIIKKDALFYDLKIVSPKEIDELNIYAATKKAMSELALEYDVKYVLTDAMPIKDNEKVISIIKGDSKSISIAGASILAKVTRDRIMKELDALYPQYELAKHKGYPTKRHLELLDQYGVIDIYRKSYKPVNERLFRNLPLF